MTEVQVYEGRGEKPPVVLPPFIRSLLDSKQIQTWRPGDYEQREEIYRDDGKMTQYVWIMIDGDEATKTYLQLWDETIQKLEALGSEERPRLTVEMDSKVYHDRIIHKVKKRQNYYVLWMGVHHD